MSSGYQESNMVVRSDGNDVATEQQQQHLGAPPQAMAESAAAREASFSTAAENLDYVPDEFLLSDDGSITKSPQKELHAKARAHPRAPSSGRKSPATRHLPMTRRTVSSGAKPSPPRMRSPSLGPQPMRRPLVVPAREATPEARLAALEEQRDSDHRVINELTSALINVRGVVEDLKARAAGQNSEIKDQLTMGFQLRQELFSIRDKLDDGIKEASHTAQAAAMTHMGATIEAKFAQLDQLTANLKEGLEALGIRENQVEKVVQAQHDGLPKQEEVITGAFLQLDHKISHVAALAKKFDGTQISSTAGAPTFTFAMKSDMEAMHTKLSQIDALVDFAVTRGVTPIHDQVSELRVKILTQDEQITSFETQLFAHKEAITALHAAPGPCQPCGPPGASCGPPSAPSNPWSHSPAAPGAPEPGQPGSSGQGDYLGILRAVIGGNMVCHCIHVKELQEKVAVLERAGGLRTTATAFQPDPWSRAMGVPDAPAQTDVTPATSLGALPLRLQGPLGAIPTKTRAFSTIKWSCRNPSSLTASKAASRGRRSCADT